MDIETEADIVAKLSEYSVKIDTFESDFLWIPGRVFIVISDWERNTFGDTTAQRMCSIVMSGIT